MDKIKELLSYENLKFEDAEIEAAIASRRFNKATISDDEALVIVEDLKGKSKLVKPNNSTVSRRKSRTKKLIPEVSQQSFNESIIHLANVAKQEVDIVTATLNQGATAWKEETKAEWKAIIRNTPVEAMNELLEEVRGEVADIESFRETAVAAVKAIFPISSSIEAE